MNIALLIPSLEPGGAERQLVALANGLAERGHRVQVILFRRHGSFIEGLSPDVELSSLNKGGKADVVGFLYRTARHLRSVKPDVLYTFLGVPNLTGALLRPFLGSTRLVWSLRASNMDMAQYGWAARLSCFLERQLSGIPDTIIANSRAGMRHAQQTGMKTEQMRVIHNGIDTDRYYVDRACGEKLRREWLGESGKELVGTVARLDPMKDHENLLKAVRIVLEQRPKVRFVCIGDGPLRDSLRARSRSLGVEHAVIWAGTRTETVAIYNALDLFCLSSAFGEGFPNVIGEAMSCDVHCVGTDVGDTKEIIGDTGRCVEPCDPEALAAAIVETLGSPGELPSPRKRMLETYSVQAMVQNTEDALRSLL